MFENPRRGRQARHFTTNAPKILDLKSSSEQIFSRKLPLAAPEFRRRASKKDLIKLRKKLHTIHEDVKKLKYVIAIKIYKILTQIQLNYKFKKITFKNILIHGLSDCLAKGVKILNGMKCSRLFAQFLLTLGSLKFSLVLVL